MANLDGNIVYRNGIVGAARGAEEDCCERQLVQDDGPTLEHQTSLLAGQKLAEGSREMQQSTGQKEKQNESEEVRIPKHILDLLRHDLNSPPSDAKKLYQELMDQIDNADFN